MDGNNKNTKLQIKSFLKKISLQLYFKRVNVPTVSKARWQSIPYCWSSMEKGSIAKSLPCYLRDYKQCSRSDCRLYLVLGFTTSSSDKYCGARPFNVLKTKSAILNSTLNFTGNQ